MTDKELMQEVLEAMESLHRTGDTQVFDMCAAPVLIPVLRERLAQPEPPVLTGIDCSCGKKWRILNNTLTASEPETVMAEYKHQTYAAYKTDGEMKIGVVPEQEQAMLDAITGGTGVMLGGKRIDPSTIYKEPEQEPVACIGTNGELMWLNKPRVIYSKPQPLFTTPPQRKPLTDEEILDVARNHYNSHQRAEISFARAIEAAHGITGEQHG